MERSLVSLFYAPTNDNVADDFLASWLGVTGTEVTILLGDSMDGRGVK